MSPQENEGPTADPWVKQIEEDLQSGQFDALLAEVDAEHKAGMSRPLCCSLRGPVSPSQPTSQP